MKAPLAAATAPSPVPAAAQVPPYGVHKPLRWMVSGNGPGPVAQRLVVEP